MSHFGIVAALGALAVLEPLELPAEADALSVTTRPVVAGRYNGVWDVIVATDGEYEYSVFDSDGARVAGPCVLKSFPVPNPKTWSDESPVCYTLVAENESNRVEKIFGFAEMIAADGAFRVNGRNVRVKLGPKELRGNSVAADSCSAADAWREGVYRLSENDLARPAVERPHADPDATRYLFQNWSVKGTNYNQRIVVENRNAFTGADGVDLEWTVVVDGKETSSGKIDLMGLAPLSSSSFDMPAEAISSRYGEGTVSVRFAFRKKGGLFSHGEILAEDQIDLVASRELNSLNPPKSALREWLVPGFMDPKVTVGTDQDGRVFKAGDAVLSFSCIDKTGIARFGRSGMFGRTHLASMIESPCDGVSPVSSRAGAAEFESAAAKWTVYPSGVVAVRTKPKSLRMFVCDFDGEIEWFGLGPRATAKGDTAGAFLGRWRIKDACRNENGRFTATEVRGLRIGDLTVRTLGAPFSFSVYQLKDKFATKGKFGVDVLEISSEEDGVSVTLSVADDNLSAIFSSDT